MGSLSQTLEHADSRRRGSEARLIQYPKQYCVGSWVRKSIQGFVYQNKKNNRKNTAMFQKTLHFLLNFHKIHKAVPYENLFSKENLLLSIRKMTKGTHFLILRKHVGSPGALLWRENGGKVHILLVNPQTSMHESA